MEDVAKKEKSLKYMMMEDSDDDEAALASVTFTRQLAATASRINDDAQVDLLTAGVLHAPAAGVV